MYNEFNKHKRKDAIKWVAIFLVVILLLVAVSALWSKGYKTINPYCWGDKHTYGEDGICINCGAEKPVEDTEQDTDDRGDGMVVAPEISNDKIMLMVTPLSVSNEIAQYSSSTYTLTATITPVEADDKEVDWTVTWKNADSTWAKGKTVTDYVTVTPTSDGALTAKLECKKSFGEQIIVTVTNRYNPELTANCTCDYSKRITRVVMTPHMLVDTYSVDTSKDVIEWSYSSSVNAGGQVAVSGSYTGFIENITYSDYTLDDTWDVTYKFSFMSDYATGVGLTGAQYDDVIISKSSSGGQVLLGKYLGIGKYFLLGGHFSSNTDSMGVVDFVANKCVNYLKTASDKRFMQCQVSCLSGRSNSLVKTVYFKAASSALVIAPTDVSVDSSYIF